MWSWAKTTLSCLWFEWFEPVSTWRISNAAYLLSYLHRVLGPLICTLNTVSRLMSWMVWCPCRFISASGTGRGSCDVRGTTVCLWTWHCSLAAPTHSFIYCHRDTSAAKSGNRSTAALTIACTHYSRTTMYWPIRLSRTTTSQVVFCPVECRCEQVLPVWCHRVSGLPTERAWTTLIPYSVLQASDEQLY